MNAGNSWNIDIRKWTRRLAAPFLALALVGSVVTYECVKPDAASAYGTPLTFACATGNVPDAQRLLALGVKADYVRGDGITPLIMATNAG